MDEGISVSPGNGRRVQVRKARKDGFNDAKKQVFLDHLAGCANIMRAAAAAGVSTETVNYHRRRDPVFAQQVAEALDAGYDMLDSMMVERAATGGRYTPGEAADAVPAADSVDTHLGLHLLSLRSKGWRRRTRRGGHEPRRASETELNQAILAKLDILDRRQKLRPGRQARGSPRPGQERGRKAMRKAA